jgi:hypothetical protein
MADTPYREGHLLVACIRVLEYQHQRPPTEEEIASLLAWPAEKVTFQLRGLVENGILARVGTAYEQRYEIRDHRKLEDLPQEENSPGFAEEMKAFDEQAARKQAELESLFREGDEPNKKRRISELDDDFRKFRNKGPANPFGDE